MDFKGKGRAEDSRRKDQNSQRPVDGDKEHCVVTRKEGKSQAVAGRVEREKEKDVSWGDRLRPCTLKGIKCSLGNG